MSKANKGKQKKKGASTPAAQLVEYAPIDERYEWEIGAETILKAMGKHSYIDISTQNTKKALANFYVTTQGQDSVDLKYLYELLLNREIRNVNEFITMLLRIFENVVERFEQLQDQEFIRRLVTGCKHLILYTRWLCLETFTLDPSQTSSSSSKDANLNFLTTENRDHERQEREKFLDTAVVDTTTISICRKLVKDMERTKNKAELIQLSYFQTPVTDKILADYSVYVRKPMDMSTIKAKLDASVPTSASSSSSSSAYKSIITGNIGRYSNHGEFISDFRRVFANAIKYNGAHLETDSTGLSKIVHEAAVLLQARLESLLPSYTLAAVDRFIVTMSEREEAGKLASKKQAYEAKVEEEVKQFEQVTQAQLKATDQMYAHDLDAAAKRKETRKQIIKQQAVAHQAFRSGIIQDSMDVDEQRLVLESGALLDTDAMHIVEEIDNLPPNISKRCGKLVVAKRRLSGNAWDFFANRATVATTEGAAKLQATFVVSGGVYPTTAHTHSALQTAKLGNANMILDPPLIQNTLSSTFLVPSNEVTSKRKHHKVLGTFSDSSLDPPLISDSGHTKSSISMNLYASGNKHTSVPSVRRIPGFDFENSPKTC